MERLSLPPSDGPVRNDYFLQEVTECDLVILILLLLPLTGSNTS